MIADGQRSISLRPRELARPVESLAPPRSLRHLIYAIIYSRNIGLILGEARCREMGLCLKRIWTANYSYDICFAANIYEESGGITISPYATARTTSFSALCLSMLALQGLYTHGTHEPAATPNAYRSRRPQASQRAKS